VRVARENGLPPPASVQNGYSLVNRMFDGDLAEGEPPPECPAARVFAARDGALSAKYRGTAWPAEARLKKFPDFGERYKRPRVLAAAEEYRAIADKHRLPLAGIALAFARSRFFTASTIIGATTFRSSTSWRRGSMRRFRPKCWPNSKPSTESRRAQRRSKEWRSGTRAGS
jgi:aryl-alcohol dehydrogenase (NADP+)